MFPTTAGPVLIPMPISSGGHPFVKNSRFFASRELHFDRARDRAFCVILQGLRRAEDGEKPVPEEVHDITAVVGNEAGECLEVVIEDRQDPLWPEFLRNGREAPQIAEEGRHLPAVRGEGRFPAARGHLSHDLLGGVARERAQARPHPPDGLLQLRNLSDPRT